MIAIPIAQSLFLSDLRTQIAALLPSIDLARVIAAGAANLGAIAGDSSPALLALREAYTHALNRPYILALSAACAAAVCVPGMEWKNIRTEAARRKRKSGGEAEGTLGVGASLGAMGKGGGPQV